jgi:hypothetical protein
MVEGAPGEMVHPCEHSPDSHICVLSVFQSLGSETNQCHVTIVFLQASIQWYVAVLENSGKISYGGVEQVTSKQCPQIQ